MDHRRQNDCLLPRTKASQQVGKRVVLATTEETLPASDKEIVNEEDDEADEEDEPKPVKVLKELASFDEVVVWGHESIPDSESDAYLKTMEEWIAFAQTMHSYDLSDGATEQGSRAS
ncbi:MAG: 3'-5' exonuclease [Pycnora praestabilis]|nr:MAG: 3'-5' exonuclease [Pycnora praestabilis]